MRQTLTVSTALISPDAAASRPLTPAMVSVVWYMADTLDRMRIPANVDQPVWITIPTAELRDKRSDNQWLRHCLERLCGVQFGGETKSGKWGAVLLAEWRFEQGGSVVRMLVPPAAISALRSPGTFAKLDAEAVHKMPGHTARLYAILADKKRQGRPSCEFTLDEFRRLLGIDKAKTYEVWTKLKLWVLEPAIQHLNDFGMLMVEYTPLKTGRAVTGLRFTWRWRDPMDAAQAANEADRHSLAAGKPTVTNAAVAAAPPLIEGDDAAWAWSVIERVLGAAWAKAWGPRADRHSRRWGCAGEWVTVGSGSGPTARLALAS